MSSPRRHHNLPINPQLLRAQAWLAHRNKKPYYITGRPRSGTLDSPQDLAKLAGYEAAVQACNNGGKFTGLGFAVNQGYQFIDLDEVIDAKGKVANWAQVVVDAAKKLGAFIELSLSGTGFHIAGYHPSGKPESFATCTKKPAERYTHGRYMAIGIKVINTGCDPLPDISSLIKLLPGSASRAKPELRLVTNAPTGTPPRWTVERAKVPGLLEVLNPDMDYPDWRNVGMALHDASGGAADGLILWDEWSAEGDKYGLKGGPDECARLWGGFKAGGGITMATLIHMAREATQGDSLRVIDDDDDAPRVAYPEMTDDELVSNKYPDIHWYVDQLVCPGLSLLAAPPKSGKSYFVLQMALCVGAGVPFLGRQTQRTQVTYFDLEEWPQLLQQRRLRIGRAHHIDKSSVRYVLQVTAEGVMQDMQRHIDSGSKLIIIDLLARVRDEVAEDSKKNVYARDYHALSKFADFILQRNPGVAIIMVHHTNKGQHEDWQNQISGSQGLAGASHTNMVLSKIDMRGMDDESKKNAQQYKRFQVIGKAAEFDEVMLVQMPHGGGWEVTDKTTDEVKLQSKHAHIMQVLREAGGAWVTAKQVHEHVEGTLDSVKKALMRMAKKGEIESSGSGGAGYRCRA